MTTRNQHGGPRQPANPAATSGPGALSQRTDGGPGNQKQPIRVPSGGAYGERAAATAQQQGAPMAAGGPAGPGGAAPVSPGSAGVAGGAGIFGPTKRPGEPITTGAPNQESAEQQLTPDEMLRVMYSKTHSPWIARLLRDR